MIPATERHSSDASGGATAAGECLSSTKPRDVHTHFNMQMKLGCEQKRRDDFRHPRTITNFSRESYVDAHETSREDVGNRTMSR